MDNKEFIRQDWVKQEIISRLEYDPDTGLLTWAVRGVPHIDRVFSGKEVGSKWFDLRYNYHRYTLKMSVKGRNLQLECPRVIWLIMTGDWPKHTIDHIDRDPKNNSWENLRDVTMAVNNFNRGFYKKSTFLPRGVIFSGGVFKAQITKDKVIYKLGDFKCPTKAALAYDAKAKELFGEYATLNFPY